MIFNFPTQTEDIPISDCEKIALCGCHQTIFSPLYQSHATTAKMEEVHAGVTPLLGKTDLPRRDLMRYKFLLQLYSLRFDKHEFERDFGVSVERGLPVEMAFMRANKAIATDNDDELTLTPAGRYLTVVLYRQYLAGLNNLREQARSKLTGDEHDLLFGDGTEK